jgi:hypothetical protein
MRFDRRVILVESDEDSVREPQKGRIMTREYVLIGAQVIIVGILATLVALGHNSIITDGLIAVCASVAGVGVYQKVTGK